jgi:hypothetical protein
VVGQGRSRLSRARGSARATLAAPLAHAARHPLFRFLNRFLKAPQPILAEFLVGAVARMRDGLTWPYGTWSATAWRALKQSALHLLVDTWLGAAVDPPFDVMAMRKASPDEDARTCHGRSETEARVLCAADRASS